MRGLRGREGLEGNHTALAKEGKGVSGGGEGVGKNSPEGYSE